MYINFWYPMAQETELGDAPLAVRALGGDFVLFRTADGTPCCLANTCVHRGGALAMGKCLAGEVQCPYHGWRYAGDGRCTHMPTVRGDARIPGRARVDAYPLVERYGLLFAFLGDLPEADRPPIMPLPEWGEAGWSVTSLVYDWQASFDRVIENGLDATHTEFVHPSAGLQGSFDPAAIQSQQIVRTEWSTACRMTTPMVAIEHGHFGVAQQWTFLTFTMPKFAGRFFFYSYLRPIDVRSVRRYLFHARDFQHGADVDAQMVRTILGFELEDRPVIENMRPVYSPRDTGSELLLPEDEIMLAYRQRLDEWQQRGWLIDVDALERLGRRRVYSIPCPGRREHRNWVTAPVPLVA